jgi:NAD(P)-dependent dehydrogenase (short-subunit alcohol dehydrogenase family)
MTMITAAATAIAQKFGKLDVLINNAGFMANPAPVSTSTEDDYWLTFESTCVAHIALLKPFYLSFSVSRMA